MTGPELIPPVTTADVMFLQGLVVESGYRFIRVLEGRRWAALRRYAYTVAIEVGTIGDRVSVGDRWCYENATDACAALEAWDGVGEPVGWHRHPATGRRVSREEGEVDEDGKRVGAVGVAYVRG